MSLRKEIQIRRVARAIPLGQSADYQEVSLPFEDFKTHTIITGRSGSGKTMSLVHQIMCLTRQGVGVSVIDPHGDISASLKQWVTDRRNMVTPGKIHFVDIADPEWAMGFNILRVRNEDEIPYIADMLTTAIATLFGSGDAYAQPLIRSFAHALAAILAEHELTLAEACFFLLHGDGSGSADDYSSVRARLIEQTRNDYTRTLWREWQSMRQRDYNEVAGSLERRLRSFFFSPYISSVIGQRDNCLDLRGVANRGETVILNLATPNKAVPPDAARLLGLLYVTALTAEVQTRDPEADNVHHALIIDECQKFLTNDIVVALDQLRKFSFSMVLSCQTLEQIRLESERIYASVKQNAGTMIVFAEKAYQSALTLAYDLFSSEMSPDRVKEVLTKPTVVGHEIKLLKSETEGQSDGEATAHSEVNSSVESQSRAHSRQRSSGQGGARGKVNSSSSTRSENEGESVRVPVSQSIFLPEMTTESTGVSQGLGLATATSTATNQFQAEAEGDVRGVAHASGRAQGQTSQQSRTKSSTTGLAESLIPTFADFLRLPTPLMSRPTFLPLAWSSYRSAMPL